MKRLIMPVLMVCGLCCSSRVANAIVVADKNASAGTSDARESFVSHSLESSQMSNVGPVNLGNDLDTNLYSRIENFMEPSLALEQQLAAGLEGLTLPTRMEKTGSAANADATQPRTARTRESYNILGAAPHIIWGHGTRSGLRAAAGKYSVNPATALKQNILKVVALFLVLAGVVGLFMAVEFS